MSELLKSSAPTIIAALLAIVGTLIAGGLVFYETSQSNDAVMANQMVNIKRELEFVIAREAALQVRVTKLEAEVRVLEALRRPQQ